jgi:hypothetical protein
LKLISATTQAYYFKSRALISMRKFSEAVSLLEVDFCLAAIAAIKASHCFVQVHAATNEDLMTQLALARFALRHQNAIGEF